MPDHTPPEPSSCAVVELRQYVMRPGGRDVLIDLFESELLETQEAQGMAVLGHFRDLDRPDRFVWLRGFADMVARQRGLEGFYGGPAWRANSAAANATMIDSDDVLLLRPLFPGGAVIAPGPRPSIGARAPESLVAVTIWSLERALDDEVRTHFRERVDAALVEVGSQAVALLETEDAVNTFPGLPVREGEHVVVRIARFDELEAFEAHQQLLVDSPAWAEIAAGIVDRGGDSGTTLRLAPASRSLLR